MKMLDVASDLDTKSWLRGIWSAAVSGGTSAVTGGAIMAGTDPTHYNFQTSNFWKLTGTLFAASAMMSVAKFLQLHPLPDLKTIKTTVQVTEQGVQAPKTVTTVEETHQEVKQP